MPESSKQPKLSTTNLIWIIVGLLVLGLVSIFVDTEITRNRRTDYLAGDVRRIITLSEIFAHGFGIAITIYLLWVLVPAKRKWIPRLAACAILPGLCVQLVKLFVARYRPGHFFPEFATRVSDTWIGLLPANQLNFEYVTQSFPSAHAATAVGFATGLIWMFPAGRNLFVTLAILSSVQRIMAGAHWMSDVFIGAAISVAVCSLIFRNRHFNKLFCNLERGSQADEIAAVPQLAASTTSDASSRAA